jgi:hypothetical protein
MDIIPNEIIYQILSYLTLEERMSKRIVCRNWNEIISQLPFNMDEKEIREISEYIKKILIQIYFIEDIIDISYENNLESKYYLFINHKFDILKLIVHPTYKPIPSIEEFCQEIYRAISIKNIKYVQTNSERISIQDIFSSSYQEVLKYLQGEIETIFSKITSDIKKSNKSLILYNRFFSTSSIFIDRYKNMMYDLKKKILSKIPKYVLNDKELFQKYLSDIKL